MEDIITVVDGRRLIVSELAAERPPLREFVAGEVAKLLADKRFLDALPGHLPGDQASQLRLPILLNKLNFIADLLGAE
jgi:hypothetical protein